MADIQITCCSCTIDIHFENKLQVIQNKVFIRIYVQKSEDNTLWFTYQENKII